MRASSPKPIPPKNVERIIFAVLDVGSDESPEITELSPTVSAMLFKIGEGSRKNTAGRATAVAATAPNELFLTISKSRAAEKIAEISAPKECPATMQYSETAMPQK